MQNTGALLCKFRGLPLTLTRTWKSIYSHRKRSLHSQKRVFTVTGKGVYNHIKRSLILVTKGRFSHSKGYWQLNYINRAIIRKCIYSYMEVRLQPVISWKVIYNMTGHVGINKRLKWVFASWSSKSSGWQPWRVNVFRTPKLSRSTGEWEDGRRTPSNFELCKTVEQYDVTRGITSCWDTDPLIHMVMYWK